MSEQKYFVGPIGVEFICDLCNKLDEPKALMEFTGFIWNKEFEAKYEHKCVRCSNVRNLNKKYPMIIWERIAKEHNQD